MQSMEETLSSFPLEGFYIIIQCLSYSCRVSPFGDRKELMFEAILLSCYLSSIWTRKNIPRVSTW